MDTNVKPTLIVLVGPTAVGKTTAAIQLATWLDTEIVSTDSRQFYREMQIGTAKPSASELKAVPHHLVDFISVEEPYDVAQFEADALLALHDIFCRKSAAIATGGSGLYVNTLCEGIDDMPGIDAGIREGLQQKLENEGLQSMAEILRNVDPEFYAQADIQNPRRVLRALEVYQQTGKTFSSFRKKNDGNSRHEFSIIKIGLFRTRDALYERINRRVDLMIEDGLFEEAVRLSPHRHLNALQTVGYQEIFGYLDGAYDQQEAIRLIKRNTRRFAKRQMTWFRRDETIQWFDADQDELQLIREIKNYIAPKV
jgi:tRNA dimethylallyltransferase